MHRSVVASLLLLAAALALPAAAAAQSACPEPTVERFSRAHAGGDDATGAAGQPYAFGVFASNALRVDVAWGDGTRSELAVDRNFADLTHVFGAQGRYPVDVVAIGDCGGTETRSVPGRLTVDIGPPCDERRGQSLNVAICDRPRGALEARAGGGATTGTWLTPPCRDTIVSESIRPERPGMARAAACAGPMWPPAVTGTIPVRRGTVVTLTLGAPAGTVFVHAGTRERPTRRLTPVRAAGATGRVFRLRVGRLPSGTRRLFVRAHDDAWAVGVRVRR